MANAVCAYAANCDNLGALSEAVARIAHKHVSLYILPEHYPIVGECILKAIKEVLGDAATDEIMEGWKNGYQFLADLFIDVERKLREEKANAEGKFIVRANIRYQSHSTSTWTDFFPHI